MEWRIHLRPLFGDRLLGCRGHVVLIDPEVVLACDLRRMAHPVGDDMKRKACGDPIALAVLAKRVAPLGVGLHARVLGDHAKVAPDVRMRHARDDVHLALGRFFEGRSKNGKKLGGNRDDPLSLGLSGPDLQASGAPIHLAPAKRKGFALAKTGEPTEPKKCPPAIVWTRAEKPPELFRVHVVPVFFRRRHAAGQPVEGVELNQVIIDGPVEHSPGVSDVEIDRGRGRCSMLSLVHADKLSLGKGGLE